MRHSQFLPALAVGLLMLLGPAGTAAQVSKAGGGAVIDTVPTDSTPKHKGGGLFGKAKKLAGNKVVKAVAKTMACTMVPGGQMIAGAMDAASSKDAGGAVTGAAGAATGTACMPGLGGMGSVPSGAAGAAGLTGVGGAAAGLAGQAAIEAAMPTPRGGMPAGAAGYAAMPTTTTEATASCLGLSQTEYQDLADPTRGEARQPTKAERKRQEKAGQKFDARRYQACTLQGSGVEGATPGSAAATTGVKLSAELARELKQGRTVVGGIRWVPGGGALAEGSEREFADAMTRLAAAMRAVGGSYRADIYLDKAADAGADKSVGPARLAIVAQALEKAGLAPDALGQGKSKKDKAGRLEIVAAKK